MPLWHKTFLAGISLNAVDDLIDICFYRSVGVVWFLVALWWKMTRRTAINHNWFDVANISDFGCAFRRGLFRTGTKLQNKGKTQN